MAFASSSNHEFQSAWPPDSKPPSASQTTLSKPESIHSIGYLSRKALPIKRNDAEPLTRSDVQFDLLSHLFSNAQAVFTNPASEKKPKMTFSDLYVAALYGSSKCSKVLKEKMLETPAFGIEFAKIALLTNVGRINTTMAFFPEMKTALRTYHPVPSLQKTDGNAQDAPRIKNCLKAALLSSELKSAPPSTPEEVLQKRRAGYRPPTSVVNLIFVLANHAAPLASTHFDGSLNFLDLFLPLKRLSSSDRARATLWLLYHYLEDDKGPNPFDDVYSSKNPGKAPTLRRLTNAEFQLENVDTVEEIEWGNVMSNQRNMFLQKLVSSIEIEKKNKSNAPHFVTVTPPDMAYPRPKSNRYPLQEPPKDERSFLYYVPSHQEEEEPVPPPADVQDMPLPMPSLPFGHRSTISEGQERTMLEHAWHMATTTDPLIDSDEEVADQHVRLDYTRRLSVIAKIRKTASTSP